MVAITQAAVLPWTKQKHEKYYFFGLQQDGKLATFGRAIKPKEATRRAAISSFIKQSLHVFVSDDVVKSHLKKPHKKVHKVENKVMGEAIFVAKFKISLQAMKEYRKRAGQEKLKNRLPLFQQIIAIRAKELCKMLKENTMKYHALPFQEKTWSTLQTAYISKRIK